MTVELECNLRVQMKMLESQAKREEKEANKERRKAKLALKKGERNFATLYASNAIRAEQHSLFLRQNAAKLSSVIADLKTAQVQQKMIKSMNLATKELEKAVGSMDLTKIASATLKYDELRGKMETANNILLPVTDEEIQADDLLNQLQEEIMVETASELQVPISNPVSQNEPSQTAAAGLN